MHARQVAGIAGHEQSLPEGPHGHCGVQIVLGILSFIYACMACIVVAAAATVITNYYNNEDASSASSSLLL